MHTFSYDPTRVRDDKWPVWIMVDIVDKTNKVVPEKNIVGYFNSATRAAVVACWLNGGAQPPQSSGIVTDPKTGLLKDA